MSSFDVPLSPEHQQIARQVWDEFAQAKSQDELIATREAFQSVPEEVRSAILRAYSEFWRQGRIPQFGKNPFE
jgi:hypothetical protein